METVGDGKCEACTWGLGSFSMSVYLGACWTQHGRLDTTVPYEVNISAHILVHAYM